MSPQQHSHPRKITHRRISILLADGIRFLVPLALVLLLCLLGIAALDREEEVQQQNEMELFPTAHVLDVQLTLAQED